MVDGIYLKQEDESFLDWKARLIVGKIEKIIDLDWSEIRDVLNLDCSPDHLRKTSYGVYEYYQYFKDKVIETISSEEIVDNYKDKQLEFEKEKIKFQDQRREYKSLLRLDARFEHLEEELIKMANEISKQKPIIWNPVKKYEGNKEGIALFSDWHSELEIDNFLNKFNKEEFKRRVNRLVGKIIEYGQLNNITTLHVFNLGDLINGIIRVSARVSNNELTITQTMHIGEMVSEILGAFSNVFNKIRFYNVLDNHSRVFANKDENIAGESFARLIPWYLKARLKDIKNIEIVDNDYDEDIIVTEICGKTCFAVHGHKDSLKDVVNDLSMMLRKIPDYVFISHWHHNIEDEVHSCEVIVNQSLMGTDDFAKSIRKTSKPAQKFIVFNEKEGREATYNIRLDIKD